MADDWKPGDLALCVRGGTISQPGAIYTVAAVGVCHVHRHLALWFAEGSGDYPRGFLPSPASRFRKIHPLNEAEHAAALRELNTPVREPAQ